MPPSNDGLPGSSRENIISLSDDELEFIPPRSRQSVVKSEDQPPITDESSTNVKW